MSTKNDYTAAAEWAEHEMTLPHNSATAVRGEEAPSTGDPCLSAPWVGGPRSTRTQHPGSTPAFARCAYPARWMRV